MLNPIKATLLAFALALLPLAPAVALITDPNKIIPERSCPGNNVCYYRVTINFNDPRISTGVWFATLPKGAFVLSIDAQVTAAFNAATTNVVTLGTTQAAANEIVATGITAGTLGVYHLTTAVGLGLTATNNVAYQTAINGNVPMFAKYTQTGAAATAGSVTIVVTTIKNNDD